MANTELEFFEYSTNAIAQENYVSNSMASIVQSQLSVDEDYSLNSSLTRASQGFQVSATDDIKKFTVRLGNYDGTATGTITGYIYSDGGTGKPNSSLATFSSVDVSTIPASSYDPATATDIEFTGTFTPTVSMQYPIVS